MPDSGYIDLHCHTTFSDGSFEPEDVVALAARAGVAVLAITDHDDVRSWERAGAAAQAAGIRLLPGVELSAEFEGREVHVLGYGLDPTHEPLGAALEEFHAARRTRAERMVRALQQLGFTITMADVAPAGYTGAIGRPHLARHLVETGQLRSVQAAFDRYLRRGRPAFVPKMVIDPVRACELIRDAGGVPVLAHPVYLNADDRIPALAKCGLGGIEVNHSGQTPSKRAKYAKLADRLGLVKTGGCDFHGAAKPDVHFGDVRTPLAWLPPVEAAIAAAQDAAGVGARLT